MYFSLLPDLQFSDKRVKYRYKESDFVLAKNIFRVIQTDNSAYSTDLFFEGIIKDGVRPDKLAYDLYGKSEYDWVILLTNKIKNLYNDWPLDQTAFETYISRKYINVNAIHHYETIEIKNSAGQIVQPKGIEVYYNPQEKTKFSLGLRDGTFIHPSLSVKDRDKISYTMSETLKLRSGFYTLPISQGPVYSFSYVDSYEPYVYKTLSASQALTTVSNYDYELELNEKKRILQILKPAYLPQFVKLFKAAIKYVPNEELETPTIKKTIKF